MKEADEERKLWEKMNKPEGMLEQYKFKKESKKINTPPKKQQLVFSSVDSRVIAEEKKKDQELDLLVASDPLMNDTDWETGEKKQVRLSELTRLISLPLHYDRPDKEFLLKCQAW